MSSLIVLTSRIFLIDCPGQLSPSTDSRGLLKPTIAITRWDLLQDNRLTVDGWAGPHQKNTRAIPYSFEFTTLVSQIALLENLHLPKNASGRSKRWRPRSR